MSLVIFENVSLKELEKMKWSMDHDFDFSKTVINNLVIEDHTVSCGLFDTLVKYVVKNHDTLLEVFGGEKETQPIADLVKELVDYEIGMKKLKLK